MHINIEKNDIRNIRSMRYLSETIYTALQHIFLANCNIGDEGGSYIGEGFCKTRVLETLILRNNDLSDETAKAIAEGMTKSHTNLKILDLSIN
jgi:Ran GTPase-activating protein (RanGAP) involved in mRNA processing and transport